MEGNLSDKELKIIAVKLSTKNIKGNQKGVFSIFSASRVMGKSLSIASLSLVMAFAHAHVGLIRIDFHSGLIPGVAYADSSHISKFAFTVIVPQLRRSTTDYSYKPT